MAEKENVLTHTYDLMLYLVPLIEKFPRSQRFLLGDRLQTEVMDLLSVLINAYYGERANRLPSLRTANLHIERIRFWVRLSKDLEYTDLSRYEFISKKVETIGQQVGMWAKATEKK